MKELVTGKVVIGGWTIEPGLDRLRRDDAEVRLEPRQMDVLIYLAGRRGEVISAEALIDEVWKGVVVGDDAVYQCISKLREALGDDSHHPTYIETIVKRGYRLIAPVRVLKKKNGDSDAPELTSKTTAGGRKKALALTGVLALALLIVAYQYLNVTRTPTSPVPERSIAVLPFADLSPDGDQEYFADGIAEDLLNALARVPQLRVTGRTSSFTFRGGNEDLRVIGEVLGVAHLLEGSVRRDGTRVRVTAQLVKASDGFHIWSETYDRDMTDIFAIQDEISQAIVAALKVTLIGEAGPLVQSSTQNMEAYNLYLQGLHQLAQRTPQSFQVAIRVLDEAIARDPDFADAYTALARVYYVAPFFTADIPLAEAAEKGRAASRMAIALAPDDPKALTSSALAKFIIDWDFEGAARDFERAVQLSPNDPEIHNFYGDYLRSVMDLEKAIEIEGRATELDPLFPVNWVDLGWAYYEAGDFEHAVAAFKQALAIDPRRETGLEGLVFTYMHAGQIDEARNAWAELNAVYPEGHRAAYHRPVFAILDGEKERANAMIDAYLAMPGVRETYPVLIAELYYLAGDIDQTLAWLERAYETRSFQLLTRFDLLDPRNLHEEPRILEILGRPGLKELIDLRRQNLGLDTAQ